MVKRFLLFFLHLYVRLLCRWMLGRRGLLFIGSLRYPDHPWEFDITWYHDGLGSFSQAVTIHYQPRLQGWRMSWDQENVYPTVKAAVAAWCNEALKLKPPRMLKDLSPAERADVLTAVDRASEARARKEERNEMS